MGSIFSKPKPPETPKIPQPPTNEMADENAANQERLRRRYARGRTSTMGSNWFSGGSGGGGYMSTLG